MNTLNATIVPRRRRDEMPPPAPLDPYVTQVIRWIAAREQRVNPNTLAKQVSTALEWPLPFTEVVLTATRGRHLLTLQEVTSRGGYGIGLSKRGREWLEREDPPSTATC
jgi:hypothetical protein